MSCKKVVTCSLLVGAIVALHINMISNSLDCRLYYLRRKVNCLNRKINRTLKGMSEENLKKYKEKVITGFENIKNKLDNLTIKEIKDKGNEIVDNILESIRNLKEELISYAK